MRLLVYFPNSIIALGEKFLGNLTEKRPHKVVTGWHSMLTDSDTHRMSWIEIRMFSIWFIRRQRVLYQFNPWRLPDAFAHYARISFVHLCTRAALRCTESGFQKKWAYVAWLVVSCVPVLGVFKILVFLWVSKMTLKTQTLKMFQLFNLSFGNWTLRRVSLLTLRSIHIFLRIFLGLSGSSEPKLNGPASDRSSHPTRRSRRQYRDGS